MADQHSCCGSVALLALDVLWFCAALWAAAVVPFAVPVCSAHAVLLLARVTNLAARWQCSSTPCCCCDSAPALLAASVTAMLAALQGAELMGTVPSHLLLPLC